MADIDIAKTHELGADGAKEKVVGIEPKLKEKFGVSLQWRGHEADLKGKGVSGAVRIGDTTLDLKVKLSLMLKPFKGQIRSGIESALDKEFAA